MTTFWFDIDGKVLRATSLKNPDPPIEDAVGSTDIAPESGRQIWNKTTKKWGPIPKMPPKVLTTEELYDMLEVEGILKASDRPRPKL